jgi:DNA-binding PadR family transcriptional regulator
VRRPNLLTPAGKRLLERIAAGERLQRDWSEEGFVLDGKHVHPLAVLRLIHAGFVEGDRGVYRITAAGRAALESENHERA